MTPAPIRVDALPDGGFVVSELPTGPNMASPALFACTEIDDALGYIKDKLEQGKSQLVHVEDEPGQMSAPRQPLDGGIPGNPNLAEVRRLASAGEPLIDIRRNPVKTFSDYVDPKAGALAARRRAFLDGDGECRPLNEAFAR